MMSAVDIKRKLFTILCTWGIVSCVMQFSSDNDPVLKHMCWKTEKQAVTFTADVYGEKFWKDLIECSVVLNNEFYIALNTCIPISTVIQAENTRNYVCLYPEKWTKMMDCVNMKLIEFVDDKDPYMELNPGLPYRTCVTVLISEADYSSKTGEPFLTENDTLRT